MPSRPLMSIDKFNPDKVPGYIDWRLPENRKEAITRVCHCRMTHGDLDHWHSGFSICDVLDLDKEQRAWYALMFGISYRTYWGSIMLQKFPDLTNTDPMKVDKWLKEPYKLPNGTTGYNYDRVIYGNDCKWNRGKVTDGRQKLTVSIQEIQKIVGPGGLYNYLKSRLTHSTTEENKKELDKFLRSIPYYGWMCAWLAAQMLYDLFDFDIDHWKLPFPDNWSSYNSVCYIYNKYDYMVSKENKPTKEMVQEVHSWFLDLMTYMNSKIPFHVDAYNVESVLCEYRKTAFGPKIKEFNFWNTAEQNILYLQAKEKWADQIENGVLDFNPMLIGQMTKRGYCRGAGYSPIYFKIVSETGMLQNIDQTYSDLPDVYSYLNVPRPEKVLLQEMIQEWDRLNPVLKETYEDNYRPENMLRAK